MIDFSLAVRNLLRNRRRSFATFIALVIGSSSILLFGGFSGNIGYEMHTRSVQRGGHLQIQHKDFYLYGSGNPTAYGIDEYAKIIEAIKNDEILQKMVLVVTPTLQFGGIAGNYSAGVSRTVIGNGFVAEIGYGEGKFVVEARPERGPIGHVEAQVYDAFGKMNAKIISKAGLTGQVGQGHYATVIIG